MNGIITPDLLRAKELAANRLLRPNFFGNVVGVGIGNKSVDGVLTETLCVRIYVQTKFDLEDLSPAVALPSEVLDIPTDVIEIGRFGREGRLVTPPNPSAWIGPGSPIPVNTTVPNVNSGATGTPPNPNAWIGPGSPIRVNTTVPNVNSGAIGTLGAVLQDRAGNPYILGCNHILAVNGRVPINTEIVSATDYNPGSIAQFRGHYVEIQRNQSNPVDCALASVENRNLMQPQFPVKIGRPLLPDAKDPRAKAARGVKVAKIGAARGMKVAKIGAATGITYGTIVDVDADLFVDYSFGTFRFSNQIGIDGKIDGQNEDVFATEGDSGAIVVDMESKLAVGMVFAEAGRFAVACPLSEVLQQLRAKVGSDLALAGY
jgi:hypothetical protein